MYIRFSAYQKMVPQYLEYWTEFKTKALHTLASELSVDERRTWEDLLQEADRQCEKYHHQVSA